MRLAGGDGDSAKNDDKACVRDNVTILHCRLDTHWSGWILVRGQVVACVGFECDSTVELQGGGQLLQGMVIHVLSFGFW